MAKEEFTEIRRENCIALVRADAAEPLARALIDREGCTPWTEAGRGTVMRFDYGGGTGVLREYLRGGFIRHFLKNAYLMTNRPLHEFRLHRRIQEQGLPVPELLGVCWERHGPFVRGAIATNYVEAPDLGTVLAAAEELPLELLRQCGSSIRSMHGLNVWHADLQVRNILVSEEGPMLIDFDRARLHPQLSPLNRARNLLRLRRSIEKNGLSPEAFPSICEGYGEAAIPDWLSRLYRGKGALSDVLSGRKT